VPGYVRYQSGPAFASGIEPSGPAFIHTDSSAINRVEVKNLATVSFV
jgi:hypothetical protein